jgi:hypothetical protein
MATASNYALRLPASLMTDVKDLAAEDAVSINQFIVVAVAEKVRSLRERRFFENRAARTPAGTFGALLAKAGTDTPIEGDVLPED